MSDYCLVVGKEAFLYVYIGESLLSDGLRGGEKALSI